MEDAARLEALYPGQNAAHIEQQQNIVVSSWSLLQERSANRREELHASCELQRFLTQVMPYLLSSASKHVDIETGIKIRRHSACTCVICYSIEYIMENNLKFSILRTLFTHVGPSLWRHVKYTVKIAVYIKHVS